MRFGTFGLGRTGGENLKALGEKERKMAQKIFLKKRGGMTADVLPPVGGWRANRKEIVMDKRCLLENLDAAKREWILELAMEVERMSDLIEPLANKGIDVSLSTLQRFVRRHREGSFLGEGEDMKETVEALAKRGRG